MKKDATNDVNTQKEGDYGCIARGVTDDKILFGTSQPLTGSLSAMGEDAILALKATKRRINEGGGIHGRMIDFIVKDDAYDSEKTVENSKYFIEKENETKDVELRPA